MKRRRFVKIAGIATLTGGGLALASRYLDFWQTEQHATYLTRLPVFDEPPEPISRESWGARAVNHDARSENGFASEMNRYGWLDYEGDLRDIYHTVVIHHSAYGRWREQSMASVQALHMDGRGWADIGYHYGIDVDGLLYAGRDIGARGASVAGKNQGVIGVMVMGHFQWEAPSMSQLKTLQTWVNHLATTYDLTHLAGHGEMNPESVCPGRFMNLYLNLLAQGAGLERGEV